MGLVHALAGYLHRFQQPAPVAPPSASFDHDDAQKYELSHARLTIAESYSPLYERIKATRATGHLWHTADDEFFNGAVALFDQFVEHVRDRKCLEIGAGPYGYLSPAD